MRLSSLNKILTFLFLVSALAGAQQINLDTQIKGSRWPAWGVDSGTANAYVVTTVAPLGPALKTGSTIEFKATHANTGASTIAVDGGSAIAIEKNVSTALAGGEILLNADVEVRYDGANFQLVGNGFTGSAPPSGAAGGDLSGTYPNPTVAKINGGSVPSGAVAHQVLVATAPNTYSLKTVPDCTDVSGNHLNYTQSTDTVSCGTSSSGGGGGGTGANSYNTPVSASSTIPYNGMWYWFDAGCIFITDASTCGVPSNGTDVLVWQDRSGNWGYAREAATGCTFTSTVAAISNKAAIAFNGSCGKYELNQLNNLLWNKTGFTIFAVAQNTLSSGSGAIVGASSNGGVEYRLNTGGKEQEILRESIQSLGTGTAASDANWHQVNVVCSDVGSSGGTATTAPTFRINRAADATIGPNPCSGFSNTASALDRLGYNQGTNNEVFKGSIAEIIVYRRVLSSTEITNVETYLHTKYGL